MTVSLHECRGKRHETWRRWVCVFPLTLCFWCEPQIIKEKARWRTGFGWFCFKKKVLNKLTHFKLLLQLKHLQDKKKNKNKQSAVMLLSPQTWPKKMFMDARVRIFYLFFFFFLSPPGCTCSSPCRRTSPARFYSCPKVRGCSQPACLELSPSGAAWQPEWEAVAIKQLSVLTCWGFILERQFLLER